MGFAESKIENCRRISPEIMLSFFFVGFRLDFRVYHLGYGPQ